MKQINRIATYLLVLVFSSILSTCTGPDEIEEPRIAEIEVNLVSVGASSATFHIAVSEASAHWSLRLTHTDSVVFRTTVVSQDTIIVDTTLYPESGYQVIADILSDNDDVIDSDTVSFVTRLRTEHLGLEGMWVSRIHITESNAYVCTDNQGLWQISIRNPEEGWSSLGLSAVDLGAERYTLTDVITDRGNEDNILVVGVMVPFDSVSVFRSIDGGNNWTKPDSGLLRYKENHGYVYRDWLQKLFMYDDRIIAVGHNVKYSEDFGESWFSDSIYNFYPYERVDEFQQHPVMKSNLWAIGSNIYGSVHVQRTEDGGRYWDYMEPAAFPESQYWPGKIALHPTDPDIFYVTAKYLYKFEDGGDSFFSYGIPLSTTPYYVPPSESVGKVVINNRNPEHLVCDDGINLYQTFDDGENWSELETNIPPEEILLNMQFDPRSEQLVIGSNNGVYVHRYR